VSPAKSVLRVRTSRTGSRVSVSLAGELDLASSPYLLDRVGSLDGPAGRPTAVLVDAAGLTFIDVAGVRALCRLAERLAAEGIDMELRRSTPQLDRLLQLLGIGRGLLPGRR
jgi:anti-anti-sigma factor